MASAKVLILALLFSIVYAVPTYPVQTQEESSQKWNFYEIAKLSTAVLVVSAGFAALISIFLPLFLYKICLLLGGCGDNMDIVSQFVLPRKINKRSVENVEPIMDTLMQAYEKYASTDLKKNSKTAAS